jgi:hypothetical protein
VESLLRRRAKELFLFVAFEACSKLAPEMAMATKTRSNNISNHVKTTIMAFGSVELALEP